MAEGNSNGNVPLNTMIPYYLKTLGISVNKKKYFDDEMLGDQVTDKTSATEVNSYALDRAFAYATLDNNLDDDLLYSFKSDFDGWTQADFDRLDPDMRKALTYTLKKNGIYTGPKINNSLSKQLTDVLAADTMPQWPAEELRGLKDLDPRSDLHKTWQAARAGTDVTTTITTTNAEQQPKPPANPTQTVALRTPVPVSNAARNIPPALVVNKAMEELKKVMAQRKINDALNTRNHPDTSKNLPFNLAIGDEVLVYREKEKWQGPYKVLLVEANKVTIDMVNGPRSFPSTHIKPYYRKEGEPVEAPDETAEAPKETPPEEEVPEPFEYPEPPQPRRRGRPRGSKNKPKNQALMAAEDQEEESDEEAEEELIYEAFVGDGVHVFLSGQAFLTDKEKHNQELALRLRREGKITTPGAPFEESDYIEIQGLLETEVLVPEMYDPAVHGNDTVFKSRMVREIKGINTDRPYEKSRLVIRGFGDGEKDAIMTQSPTIQRSSQRIIFALAPSFLVRGLLLAMRDIIQAYPQSKSELVRRVIAHLPRELKEKFPEGTILRVAKALYGLAESGAHWYGTYQPHHIEKLFMRTSPYDPCLMISRDDSPENAKGVTGLQTDDTFFFGNDAFMKLEEMAIREAGFKTKPREFIQNGDAVDFNGCRVSLDEGIITITQKGQADLIELVEEGDAAGYLRQRARGAYIASICQPEATFDFAVAAQATKPEKEDYKLLNKRLQWQIDNKKRGIRFLPLDIPNAQIYVFVDGAFANNRDLSSQIGYIVVIGNEELSEKDFKIVGNLLHYTSTKCKRKVRSNLTSEIYAMVEGYDLGYVVHQTINTILEQFDLPHIPFVVCTDSYSLYQCLVKLGSTSEKRLMIDIMALRESYERREINTIRWIAGDDNPADALTKANPNGALSRFVSSNELTIRIEGWTKRKEDRKKEGD